jgi:hypothetical protein
MTISDILCALWIVVEIAGLEDVQNGLHAVQVILDKEGVPSCCSVAASNGGLFSLLWVHELFRPPLQQLSTNSPTNQPLFTSFFMTGSILPISLFWRQAP